MHAQSEPKFFVLEAANQQESLAAVRLGSSVTLACYDDADVTASVIIGKWVARSARKRILKIVEQDGEFTEDFIALLELADTQSRYSAFSAWNSQLSTLVTYFRFNDVDADDAGVYGCYAISSFGKTPVTNLTLSTY